MVPLYISLISVSIGGSKPTRTLAEVSTYFLFRKFDLVEFTSKELRDFSSVNFFSYYSNLIILSSELKDYGFVS
jgi:hypothetical protein